MIKLRLIFAFLAITYLVSCEKQQVNQSMTGFDCRVSLKYPELEEEIRHYIADNLTGKLGVIVLEAFNEHDTSSFIVSSTFYIPDIRLNLPSHYLQLGNKPVLLYTGVENELIFDSAYSNRVIKMVEPFLESVPSNYNPVVVRLDFFSGKLTKRRVLN